MKLFSQITIAVTAICVPVAKDGPKSFATEQMRRAVAVSNAPSTTINGGGHFRRRRPGTAVDRTAGQRRRYGHPSVRLGREATTPASRRDGGRVQARGYRGQGERRHGRRGRVRRTAAALRRPWRRRSQVRSAAGDRPTGRRSTGRHAVRAPAAVEQRETAPPVPGKAHLRRRHNRPAAERVRKAHHRQSRRREQAATTRVGSHGRPSGAAGTPVRGRVVFSRPAAAAAATPGVVVVVHAGNDDRWPTIGAVRRHGLVVGRGHAGLRFGSGGRQTPSPGRTEQQPEPEPERQQQTAAAAAAARGRWTIPTARGLGLRRRLGARTRLLFHVLVQFGQRAGRSVRVPAAGASPVRVHRRRRRGPHLVRAQRRHRVRQTAVAGQQPPFARQISDVVSRRSAAVSGSRAASAHRERRQELRRTIALLIIINHYIYCSVVQSCKVFQ